MVISIIAILAAMLLPALQRARASAHSASCQNLLKQFGLMTMMYLDEHEEWTPNVFEFHSDQSLRPYSTCTSQAQFYDTFMRCAGDGYSQQTNRLNNMGPRPGGGRWYSSFGGNWIILTRADPWQVSWKNRKKYSGDASQMLIWTDSSSQGPGGGNEWSTGYSPNVPPVSNVCFRHFGVANSVYLDGHVGRLRPATGSTDGGHEVNALGGYIRSDQRRFPWDNGTLGVDTNWIYE